jgi:competence protein ComEC
MLGYGAHCPQEQSVSLRQTTEQGLAEPWSGGSIAGLGIIIGHGGQRLREWLNALWAVYARSLAHERDERRFFLWVPVIAGAGALTHLTATQDPSLPVCLFFTLVASAGAFLVRERPWLCLLPVAFALYMAGMTSAALRVWFVSAPVLERTQILRVSGWIEELDPRQKGARFLVRVHEARGLTPETGLSLGMVPERIRVSTR